MTSAAGASRMPSQRRIGGTRGVGSSRGRYAGILTASGTTTGPLPHVLALDHAGWYVAGLRSGFRSDTVGAEPPGFPRTCTRWSRATIKLVRVTPLTSRGREKFIKKHAQWP